MASASPTDSCTMEMTNHARLCLLLLDVGCQVFREALDRIHPPARLQTVLSRYPVHSFLESLYKGKTKILNSTQWGNLYPNDPSSVSSKNFDITLLTVLLENVCYLSPPATGWDNVPPVEEQSIEADIIRVRYLRDLVYGNGMTTSANDTMFSTYWQKIRHTLVRLGGVSYGATIDKMKTVTMDSVIQEHLRKLLKQWKVDEENIRKKMVQRKGKYSSTASTHRLQSENRQGTVHLTGQGKNNSDGPPQLSVNLPKLTEVEVPTKEWKKIPLPIDILLLTIEESEFLNCYAHLHNCFRSSLKELGYVYFGEIGNLKVALIRHEDGSTNPDESLICAKNTIIRLTPKAVFSVGICSALSPAKANLGDVVISSKLVTYAHSNTSPTLVTRAYKISTNEGAQDCGTKTHVISRAMDGWKAPLTNPDEREIKAHCGGVILSVPELVNSRKECEELMQVHPDAVAIEMEGGGLHTTAYDLKMTCFSIKGIAGYADGTITSEGWETFANLMAASVVANILSDANIFQDWPHYNDGFEPIRFIDAIRQQYIAREGMVAPFAWCEELNFRLNNIFTRLKLKNRTKTGGSAKNEILRMTSIFKPHERCSKPRTVLIVGKPGMGKTTYCQKLAYDWATGKQETDDFFPDFDILLLLHCRDVITDHDLWETIADQVLPSSVTKEETRQKFFKFIMDNQSKVLLVLDGLDELHKSNQAIFTKIIQGRELPQCHVVATAWHDAGISMRESCDTLLKIVGFTEDDARKFILQHFKNNQDSAMDLLDMLDEEGDINTLHKEREDRAVSLIELIANPLNAALLCLVWEELEGTFPETATELLVEIVQCVLKRFVKRKGLSADKDDLIKIYKAQLKHLGRIALHHLENDCMDFKANELGNEEGVISEFGFLSMQTGSSKVRPCKYYGFQHQTFQEFFAAFYLSCQILEVELNVETLVNDIRYFNELKQVLLFSSGLIGTQCKETALRLVKSILSQINRLQVHSEEQQNETNEKLITCALQCLGECRYKESNFPHLFENYNGNTVVSLLAEALNLTTTLTKLDLFDKNIDPSASHVLSAALKVNTTLTILDLYRNNIGNAGICALAKSLEINFVLKELYLGKNKIGDDGACSLAESLKVNTGLTSLNLGGNDIGEAGGCALAKSLKVNASLTRLNLVDNNIDKTGGCAFAETLKVNTSLTTLDLLGNSIGDVGGCALAQALNDNTTLTRLGLDANNVGDAGACALAESLKVNTTLTKLDLDANNIHDAGACAFAESLKINGTLSKLYLAKNYIGDTGACLFAELLRKSNTSLTKLALNKNNIGETGAHALAEVLKFNTSLTRLDWGAKESCKLLA